MAIKLDMGKAWNDAVAMLSAHKEMILVVAGVFFFLPNAIGTLSLPPPAELEAMAASGAAPDFEAMGEIMTAYYVENWWIFLLLSVVQIIGTLGLLSLLADTGRPTVGEALAFGAKALVPYIATQILGLVIIGAAAVMLIGLGSLINSAVAALFALIWMVLAIYLMIKFSLSSPVIGIEKVMNPLRVLQRSWTLTKGNSLRLLGFYLLLIVVLIVISLIAGMVFSIFAILGEQVGVFGTAIGGALVSMGFSSVMLAVLASVHRQLSGGSSEAVRDTFE